jgi:catechol 2,3-dioxygenase-like lactoylglutathione lyase family enzyme
LYLPTRSLAESLDFYIRMGWRLGFREETLALVELGAARFLLQSTYLPEWAENTMVHLTVDDARAWYRRAMRVQLEGAFSAVAIRPPERTDYGAVVTHVTDPSGVILQFAELDGLSGRS